MLHDGVLPLASVCWHRELDVIRMPDTRIPFGVHRRRTELELVSRRASGIADFSLKTSKAAEACDLGGFCVMRDHGQTALGRILPIGAIAAAIAEASGERAAC